MLQAEDKLNAHAELLKKKTLQNKARMNIELKEVKARITAKQQQYFQEEKQRRIAGGASEGFTMNAAAMLTATKRLAAETKAETIRIRKKYNVYNAEKVSLLRLVAHIVPLLPLALT